LDIEICLYAEAEGRIIVSKDEDFIYLANRVGASVRILWVRLGNCRTSALLSAIGRAWPNIEACLNAGDRIIEIR
jgi:predicted nuclease of predicted toxin-antitoxin system